ncbi:MAG TPA: AAA family ATPase [Candidatus Limnocylindria bacterium]|nr:AAA family ATPase [Candidatus Limnocylindria bacterium]
MDGMRDQLVGREQELEAIEAFLAAREALPAALVVEGPAGVGKTTLWREAVDRAAAAGYRVLTCRPAGTEQQLLFGALTDLLVGHIEDVLPRLPSPQRRAIEVVLLLADDRGRPAEPRTVAAAVLGLVRELEHDGPILVAIDDAQWLDPASAMVLEYVLRRLGSAQVAVLASWRIDPLSGRSRAADDRSLDVERALERSPAKLALGPLSAGAIHRILRLRTGEPVPRPLLRRIYEASGGNPFYALEIVRAVNPGQGAWETGDPLALSASLQELLVGRFADLSGETRAALFVAAAASPPTTELVGSLMGTDAAALLKPAVDASIVRVHDSRVEFTHPLLAAAAYSQQGPEERRSWHARLAEAATDPEARARHLAVAKPGQDPEVAELLHAAGEHARSRGAPAAAGELFAEAIRRLTDHDLEARARWSVEAATVLRQAGDMRLARSLVEAVIDELPAGPLRSDALLALSALVEGDVGGDALEVSLIDRALEDAGDDPARRAAALLRREMWERHQDRLADGLRLAREALELAELTGDEVLVAGALTRVADLEVLLGLADDPVVRFERALEAGRHLHLAAKEDSAPAMLAVCLVRAGRIDEARTLLLAERERVLADGDEASIEILSLFLTELEWLAGNWDLARAYAEEGLLVTEQAESRMMQGATSAMLALVDASRGDAKGARSRVIDAIALCEEVGDRSYATYAQQVLGFIELSVGDAASAHEHLAPTLSIDRGIEGTKRISMIGDDIEALVLLGRTGEAEALTDELERRGELLHRPTLSVAAARCRGLVLGSRGEFQTAVASAEGAVALATELGLPFERARSLLVLGDIQRRAKQRRAARETLTASRAAFDELGATLWRQKAEDSLARVGGRERQEGLTPTELQVATLVARGLTNKEVAAELFVTVRAVEANLSRIYAKLKVRSRTELAARL